METALTANRRSFRVSAAAMGRYLADLSLASRFILAGLVVFVVATVILGRWVGAQIESSVLNRTASVTSLYVDSVVSPRLQSLGRTGDLDSDSVASVDALLERSTFVERIVALKVWRPDGTIAYSPNRALIGRRFPVEGGLARALSGEVAAEISDLSEAENEYERARWSRLVEVYAPVYADNGGPLIAVTEFYQQPDPLEAEVRSAQLGSWAVVGLVMLGAYAALAGIVRRGSDTIARQAQSLRERVSELQAAIAENRRLQSRVAHAALSTTTSNEQALRRISADLHDGPAQVLALALLRLDELPAERTMAAGDAATVRHAVTDALDEIRAIAAGLRTPELDALSLADVVERTARDHERHSGTPVRVELDQLPVSAPLAIKIAVHRILQEAFSNATRHGRADAISLRASASDRMLQLTVEDRGRGFAPASGGDGLGIAGMRERAELLGGSFAIDAASGKGTTVRVSLPLLPEQA